MGILLGRSLLYFNNNQMVNQVFNVFVSFAGWLAGLLDDWLPSFLATDYDDDVLFSFSMYLLLSLFCSVLLCVFFFYIFFSILLLALLMICIRTSMNEMSALVLLDLLAVESRRPH